MKRVENDVLVNGPVVVDAFGSGKHGHTDGDPAINEDGTRIMADFLDHVQEEIAKMLEANGVTLDPATYGQSGPLIAGIASGIYGDGSDGDLNVPAATTVTLNSDVYADNVTVEAGAELKLAGFRLFVRGTLTMESASIISASGEAGVTAGGDRYDPGGPFFFEGGSVGATGTVNAGANGGAGGATLGGGGAGGDGGAGAQPGGSGGASSAMNVNAGKFRNVYDIMSMSTISSGGTIRQVGGGGAGGAGGGDGADLGGHGGGGGGVGFVAAFIMDLAADASIQANGGDGGPGAGANTGGGGGGEGGDLGVAYRTIKNGATTQFTATGGSGGAGGGAGAAGADGDDGTVVVLRV